MHFGANAMRQALKNELRHTRAASQPDWVAAFARTTAGQPIARRANHSRIEFPVQPRLQKHLAFAVGQIKSTTRAVLLRTRGVAQRHETWGRMRWTRTCCGRTASDADGE